MTGFCGSGVPLPIRLLTPLFVAVFFWAIYKRHFLPVLWILLTVLLGGFILSDPPGSFPFVVAIPAIVWLMAMPLDWLIAQGHPRLALVLIMLILVTDLVFYITFYVPGGPRDLIHAFPPLPQL